MPLVCSHSESIILSEVVHGVICSLAFAMLNCALTLTNEPDFTTQKMLLITDTFVRLNHQFLDFDSAILEQNFIYTPISDDIIAL